MKLDLITKLAKLANNNPNENEANLAARKVCKLLAEGEFKFVEDTPVRKASDIFGSPYNAYNKAYEDIFGDNKDFWENIRKAQYARQYDKEPEGIKCPKCKKVQWSYNLGEATWKCKVCGYTESTVTRDSRNY